MAHKMKNEKCKMLNTHRGFVDPFTLFGVVFIVITLTLAVPQVLKIQNINEKAAIAGSCDSYGTSSSCSGACSPNGFKCKWLSASSKCSEGAISCASTPTGPTASEVVSNSYSSCSPSPTYAWCGGCGGFCIKVGTTSCNEEILKKCGQTTVYTAPVCNSTTNVGVVVVNTGVTDLVRCDGTRWVSDPNLKIENITPAYVPTYLKPDYDKAITALASIPKPTPTQSSASQLAQLAQQQYAAIPKCTFTSPRCSSDGKNIEICNSTGEILSAGCGTFGCTNGKCNTPVLITVVPTPKATIKSIASVATAKPTPVPTPKIIIPIPNTNVPPTIRPTPKATQPSLVNADKWYLDPTPITRPHVTPTTRTGYDGTGTVNFWQTVTKPVTSTAIDLWNWLSGKNAAKTTTTGTVNQRNIIPPGTANSQVTISKINNFFSNTRFGQMINKNMSPSNFIKLNPKAYPTYTTQNPPEGLTVKGNGNCDQIRNSNCDGNSMFKLYLWYKNQPNEWWNKDGDFTPADFLAMMLTLEATGGSPKLLESISVATSNQLWGSAPDHQPYCTTPNCDSGIFNFLGAYSQTAASRYNVLVSNSINGNLSQDAIDILKRKGYSDIFAREGYTLDKIANDTIFNPISQVWTNDSPVGWGNANCGADCNSIQSDWINKATSTGTTNRCGLYYAEGTGVVTAVFTPNQVHNLTSPDSPCN